MDLLRKSVLVLLALALSFGAGVFIGHGGRQTEVRYVTRPTISGKVEGIDLQPKTPLERPKKEWVYVFVPSPDSLKNEGVLDPEKAGIDTLKTLWTTVGDWNKKREYAQILFDTPELGRMELLATVQHNKLTGAQWNYTPVARTIYKDGGKSMKPFVRASGSTLGYFGIGGGLQFKKWSVDISYLNSFVGGQKGLEFGVIYSF